MPVQVVSARNVTAPCRIDPSELGQFLTFSIRGKLNRFETRASSLSLLTRSDNSMLRIALYGTRYSFRIVADELDTRKDKQYPESLEGVNFHDRTLAFWMNSFCGRRLITHPAGEPYTYQPLPDYAVATGFPILFRTVIFCRFISMFG